MPLFKRHKILLGILLFAPQPPTRTQFVKWLFLLRQETSLFQDESFYDFIPYRYGPFSFLIFKELSQLKSQGYIAKNEFKVSKSLFKNAKAKFESLPLDTRQAITYICRNYGKLSNNDLIDYIYKKYPWFASRSELRVQPKVESQNTEIAIYTSGYEGESIDKFLQKLIKSGIKQLLDVRNNPISRKYGFSKKSLNRLCGKLNINYVHIPELGIPSSLRTSLSSFDDYQILLNKYEKDLLPQTVKERKVASSLIEKCPTTLFCFESDNKCCHRSRLANMLSIDTGLDVIHL